MICIGAGLRGSRIWNVPERATEGACGETRAEMGIEAWERLRREGARRGGCVVISVIAGGGLLMDAM